MSTRIKTHTSSFVILPFTGKRIALCSFPLNKAGFHHRVPPSRASRQSSNTPAQCSSTMPGYLGQCQKSLVGSRTGALHPIIWNVWLNLISSPRFKFRGLNHRQLKLFWRRLNLVMTHIYTEFCISLGPLGLFLIFKRHK